MCAIEDFKKRYPDAYCVEPVGNLLYYYRNEASYNKEEPWLMFVNGMEGTVDYAPGEDPEFINGFGSLPISDLMWMLTAASRFKFGAFAVQKCVGWWEVNEERVGFLKNPKRIDSQVTGDSCCFTLTEAIEFVKSRLAE